MQANLESLQNFKETGRAPGFGDLLTSLVWFNEFIGLPEYNELGDKYRPH